jgi:hypothetical protein
VITQKNAVITKAGLDELFVCFEVETPLQNEAAFQNLSA